MIVWIVVHNKTKGALKNNFDVPSELIAHPSITSQLLPWSFPLSNLYKLRLNQQHRGSPLIQDEHGYHYEVHRKNYISDVAYDFLVSESWFECDDKVPSKGSEPEPLS